MRGRKHGANEEAFGDIRSPPTPFATRARCVLSRAERIIRLQMLAHKTAGLCLRFHRAIGPTRACKKTAAMRSTFT